MTQNYQTILRLKPVLVWTKFQYWEIFTCLKPHWYVPILAHINVSVQLNTCLKLKV